MPHPHLDSLSPFPTTAATRFGWIPSPSDGCPSEETIRQAVDRDLGLQETRELVDHLSVCRGCFDSWRGARANRRAKLLS